MKTKSLYQDYDALAYKPHSVGEERGAINHIKKAKQKTKGLEVVFDPKRHKDFVTGFRKRKQQRRKVANQQLEKKAKQQRVEQRAERRKEMKHELGLPEDYGIHDSDSEQDVATADASAAAAAAAAADVKQYSQAGFTTTVSITNLNAGFFDSDEEAAGPSEAEEDAAAPAPQQQQGRKTALKGHKVKHGAVIKKSISKGHSSSKKQRSGKLRKK